MKKWEHHPLSLLEPCVVVNQEAEEVWLCQSTERTCHLWHVVSHSAVSSIEANHLRTRVSGYILFIPGIIKRLFLAVYSLISLSTLPLKHTVFTVVAVGNHHARSGTNCSTTVCVSTKDRGACCQTGGEGEVTEKLGKRMAISKWQRCILRGFINSNKMKQPEMD